MKRLPVLFIAVLVFTSNLFAQSAGDYFPSQTGFKWLYRSVPLDSLNMEVDSLAFFRADSFSSITAYEGRTANTLLSKSGPLNLLPVLPYSDSVFLSPENSNMFEYSQVGTFAVFLSQLDSVFSDSVFSFLNFFRSLEDWYSVYRFSQPVNNQYTIFTVDTTINFQSQNIPLRFKYLGKRLNDETIQTEIGTFDCKKIFVSRGISYLILIPPLPPIEVPIAYINDSLWIAPGNWIVKSFIPTTNVDLSLLGFGAFYIPGLKMDIQDQVVSVSHDSEIPDDFILFQNYPNPFNPSTTIEFVLDQSSLVKLEIYDVLGNKIISLVNDVLHAGKHSYKFDSKNLSSGIYYCRLTAGSRVTLIKMTLLK